MTSTDARQVWNIALSEDRRYQVLCTFFITCYLTCQHCKWGKPQCHASINKAYKILCCLLDLARLIDWVNDLAEPRGCLRCHFVSQLPKHGQSPQWRLKRGNGLPAGCCVVLHACVLELITGSCDAIDIFLFKKRKREWNRKSCSIQLSTLWWKQRVQKKKNKIKKPSSVHQPGSTLSPPIYPSSSRSPPFSPSLLLWWSLVLSVYRRWGEGAGKGDSAPLTLSLIPSSVPTDTQTLSTVRSSSL